MSPSQAELRPATPVLSADAQVRAPFDRLARAFREQPVPDLAARRATLQKLLAWTLAHRDAINAAISADFGNRSVHETTIVEHFVSINSARHTLAHLSRWMRPEARPVHYSLLPASARLQRQPRGVVGILSPWNYPFQLMYVPLVTALAAGNRVLLKPSELTPRFNDVAAEMCRANFPADQVDIVTGGPDVGAAFTRLPFDFVCFTGSTAVGRKVMQAAAEHLTPVLLELGGKSPAIVHPSFSTRRAAERIAAGKLINAGQTCVAPDYALVHPDQLGAFVQAFTDTATRSYPRFVDNKDYTSIISERQHSRLQTLVDDAARRGATIRQINPAGEKVGESRKFFPTLILDATPDMAVMQEEIFGPILPVLPAKSLDEAIAFVNDRPRPLALYYFDDDGGRVEQILARTTSGGVTVNDVLLHGGQDDLPFGGVGESGIGAYHGFDGFRAFSHEKSVFYQSRLNGVAILAPPYGKLVERVMRWIQG